MPDLAHLLLFIGAGLLLNLTPGPDVFFIVSHALRGGVRRGLVAACGIAAGCCVHVLAAAVGVSALVAASATAFSVLKGVGAGYLVYVGITMLFARKPAHGPELAAPSPAGTGGDLPASAVFRRGFLTNVLNPKVALFFLAFVPQFIVAGTPHAWAVFLALGLLFTFNGLWVCAGWALAAAWAARRAGFVRRGMQVMERAAGAVFIAFGVRLAFTDAPAAH